MRRTGIVVLALACLPLTACGNDDERDTLTVFAAASLTSTFEQLEKEFEQAHPDVDVRLSFAGSSDLVAQITEGAAADVFASADTANMDKLAHAGLVDGAPVEFATNTLTIAVPPGNPGEVDSLDDLADPDLAVVTCDPEVPCGSATTQVTELAGVTLSPASQERSVTDVLAKVSAGEADAGLVYVTDVTASGGDVDAVAFAESGEVVNRYPIARVADSDQADLAQEWIDLVLGDGQDVLNEAGFGPPA